MAVKQLNVSGATEELNFKFNLSSNMWLVAPILASTVI